ncbi:hypothetical protein CSOJ01_15777 [Colletotrichum sojae]|uniref:Uncharacterized protein n=1 Tax=Colletotrichum sojae TaxID=2175907 RepID=A0A8H6MIB6_9PEZI|nr:hypothetical protein CSOJ01_15777 [Colletotrichum sojae]
MRILSLEKENHVKDAIIRNLRTEIETARQSKGKTHGAGVNTEKLWKKLHRSQREKNSYSHKLRDMREESAAKIHTLEAAKADLQTQIHTTSKNHCKEKVALQNEVQHLRQQNDDISHRYKELLEQKAGLQIEIKNMDENKKQMDARFAQLETGTNVNNDYSRQLEAQLGSANRQLQHVRRKHVDELDQLRREIQTKAVLIQQLQQDYRYHGSSNDQPVLHRQPGPLEHSSDSNAQRTALQEARERTNDLENKVKGLKKPMEDKKSELAVLEKSWADKLSAVADREKRCADRETYIATLEKELEEVRGTLEDVIGRVSSHQDSKRRHTEDSEDLI